jgi:lysophospholipase L1-like esterase
MVFILKLFFVGFLGVLPVVSETAHHNTRWVGTWVCSPMHPDRHINLGKKRAPSGSTLPKTDVTIREVIRVSIGGDSLRVRFSNSDGSTPLFIGAAEVARSRQGSAIESGTNRPITFNGRSSVSIPAGALVVSDAVPFHLLAVSDLTVSFYVADAPDFVTRHQLASASTYNIQGNVVSQPDMQDPEVGSSWEYLNGVDVLAPENGGAIVVLGDSITDGAYSTPNANHRWPDELAVRLQANPQYNRLSVLNEGISGNKILISEAGPNALARFDVDVLSQTGVKYLIILEGINDIGRIQEDPTMHTTAADLIFALDQMIRRARAHGIVVIGSTLSPYRGFSLFFSEKGEAIRVAVNQWIRSSGEFDGVIDFDAALRDPSHPDTLFLGYDHGDHLHPNDTGYKAMGDFVDLKLFTLKPGKL